MLPESLDETPGKHMHLAYDKGNQLVQVTVQEQGKHITQSYRYDAFGKPLANTGLRSLISLGARYLQPRLGWLWA